MFEEFGLAKKCRFKVLQCESPLDGGMVKTCILQHFKEVEDLIPHGLVLDDFVAEQSGAEILRRKTYNQLIMREFIDEQVDGFFPTAMILKAIPYETALSSHVIDYVECGAFPAWASGRHGIYGC